MWFINITKIGIDVAHYNLCNPSIVYISESLRARPESCRSSVARGDVHGYDAETEQCLEVEFPPFYYSTHGLSRPASPSEEDKNRYAQD